MSTTQRKLYHLVPPDVWAQTGGEPYRAPSLATEGFIHCSYRHQVEWAANKFYTTASELLLLSLDPNRVVSPVRDEDSGAGELFPHIYGPIPLTAVVAIDRMTRDAGGRWVVPGTVAD